LIRVLCWLWQQEKTLYRYGPADVDTWASMVSRHLTLPYRLACVTNTPKGIDSSVEILPLPEIAVSSSRWPSSKGLPQCFRRLDLWRADAAKTYGERIVSMDLDCVVTGSLDPLFDRPDEVVMCQGRVGKAAYNGSMLLLKAGVRPQVFNRISQSEMELATMQSLGSDQAWIGYVLGPNEATWTENDGVYRYSVQQFPAPVKNRRNFAYSRKALPLQELNPKPPENMRVLFFAGAYKPRDLKSAYPFIAEHYC
jgi:hypothetical protein